MGESWRNPSKYWPDIVIDMARLHVVQFALELTTRYLGIKL